MNRRLLYRYRFNSTVALEDVEASLLLAIWGTESLHGESQTRLDAAHAFDRQKRTCVIAADTEVGRDVARLFCGFLRREYGDDVFRVQRICNSPEPQPEQRAACA